MDRTPASEEHDKAAWIRGLVEDFASSPDNSLGNAVNDKAFARPLVGFARGDDPLFLDMKEDIGPFYLTPLEAFEKAYPESGAEPGDLTVISCVMPHIRQSKLDNRREKTYPSERWARGKKFGMVTIDKLQKLLIETLREAGYRAMAPVSPSHWKEARSDKYGYASTWSERHAAYAAGLGTFGLCDGLITPVGKAMRCTSVVAEIAVPPTGRPYTSHTEYCLFLNDGSCGLCIHRCPVGALSKDGHNKDKCQTHVDHACMEYIKTTYGFDEKACGLCQTGVPCESSIPVKKTGRRERP